MNTPPITVDPTDTEYDEVLIEGVERDGDGWAVEQNGGWTIWVKDVGIEPRVGGAIRLYGRGIGYEVRGILIDGQPVRYETDAAMRARHEQERIERDRQKREDFDREGRAKQDVIYDALPRVFQTRIDRFRRHNPNFRWDYEPYELFCCQQAVLIANTFGTPERIAAWADLPWDEQKRQLPGLDDGHSGNTFACAVGLAKFYTSETPQRVFEAMGALVPLVGSEAYGDKIDASHA